MFGDNPVENGKWKVEKLENHLISIENGKSFVCSDSKRKGKYPAILKLSAVTYGDYNQNENKALLDECMFIKNTEVNKGDLLFTRKNTPELVGMAAYVFETERYLMMPDLIFRLNVKSDLNKIYLWKLINHPIFRERIQNLPLLSFGLSHNEYLNQIFHVHQHSNNQIYHLICIRHVCHQ